MIVYETKQVRIETEPAEIPWLKLFAKPARKEFSHCAPAVQTEIFSLLLVIEQEMLVYFKADKINIASFGNMLPEVHWHIMARFKTDSYFPEPMWGEKQRTPVLDFPSMDGFIEQLVPVLGDVAGL